jgi:hypothetical protein
MWGFTSKASKSRPKSSEKKDVSAETVDAKTSIVCALLLETSALSSACAKTVKIMILRAVIKAECLKIKKI